MFDASTFIHASAVCVECWMWRACLMHHLLVSNRIAFSINDDHELVSVIQMDTRQMRFEITFDWIWLGEMSHKPQSAPTWRYFVIQLPSMSSHPISTHKFRCAFSIFAFDGVKRRWNERTCSTACDILIFGFVGCTKFIPEVNRARCVLWIIYRYEKSRFMPTKGSGMRSWAELLHMKNSFWGFRPEAKWLLPVLRFEGDCERRLGGAESTQTSSPGSDWNDVCVWHRFSFEKLI